MNFIESLCLFCYRRNLFSKILNWHFASHHCWLSGFAFWLFFPHRSRCLKQTFSNHRKQTNKQTKYNSSNNEKKLGDAFIFYVHRSKCIVVSTNGSIPQALNYNQMLLNQIYVLHFHTFCPDIGLHRHAFQFVHYISFFLRFCDLIPATRRYQRIVIFFRFRSRVLFSSAALKIILNVTQFGLIMCQVAHSYICGGW